MTGTLIPTSTATRTATASAVPTSAPVVQQSVVIVVPNIIINSNNTNTNTNSGGGGSSGAGGFSAVTPAPMQGQGGATVWDGNVCSGYYIRARVYVDDNGDKMMSPAEGITGLNIHLLDQTYAKAWVPPIPKMGRPPSAFHPRNMANPCISTFPICNNLNRSRSRKHRIRTLRSGSQANPRFCLCICPKGAS